MTAVTQRAEGGRRRDHREHAHDRRRLPAARVRRRPRQPVLPAVRADRDVRPARVAHLRADRRAGPRLPPHRPGQGRRSTRTASRCNSIWIRAYTPTITFALRSRADQVRRPRGVRRSCSSPRCRSSRSLPTQFINAGSEKILAGQHRAAVGRRRRTSSSSRRSRPRRSSTPIPTSSSSRRPSRARATPASRRSSAAQSGRPPNSATMTVRLDPSRRPGGRRRPRSRRRWRRSRPTATTSQVSEAAGLHARTASTSSSAREDPALVASTTETVVAALADNPDLANLKSDLVKATAEIQVTVDPNKAIGVGLTAAQVADEVRTALVPTTATQVTIDGRQARRPHRPGRSRDR